MASLPEPVYRELVDMLFSMRLPILGMGLLFAVVSALIAVQWNDMFIAALAVATAAVTVARLLTLSAYARATPVGDRARLRRWERRYAVGSFAFALLLGLLNLRAMTIHYPVLHLITVSLVFSFGAGIVSRISIRPRICVVSLLLATVPTVAGLFAHALTPHDSPLHAELFAIEGVLVAMITALSLQSVGHIYHSTVLHLTAKHDMAHLANQDALTGLPNRLLLREQFRERVAAASQADGRLALHFIDLDGFKAVNDGFGHPAGDVLLQRVARRLQDAVRADDTVARLGGDEFVVVQVDIGQKSEAEMLARRIIRKLSAPYEVDGHTLRISASIGIATTRDLGPDLDRLIACADAALYRSKTGGKARHHFYSPEDETCAARAVA